MIADYTLSRFRKIYNIFLNYLMKVTFIHRGTKFDERSKRNFIKFIGHIKFSRKCLIRVQCIATKNK